MRHPVSAFIISSIAAALLAACGGGGGDSSGSSDSSRETGSTQSSSASSSSSSTSGTADWTPQASSSWLYQLTGTIDTSTDADLYDVDLFDTSADTIKAIQADGHHVICYFSAGSAENWRSDYSDFAASDLGDGLSGWAGEYWLDTRSDNVRSIMETRMDLAASKGCNGVDADNVDGYSNDTGFDLTSATQLDYNRFLATQAHARGLAIGLKNDVGQLSELVSSFDFAVNESCHVYDECDGYAAFTGAGKAVLNIEYDTTYISDSSAMQSLCTDAAQRLFYTLVLPTTLDGSYRYSCD